MNQKSYGEALKEAQKIVSSHEELKEKNFNMVNTEGFEKAVVLLSKWARMTMDAMLENKNFRIEIKYNAEAKKTSFAIYTPTVCDKSDN